MNSLPVDTTECRLVIPVGHIFSQIAKAINERPTFFLDGQYRYMIHTKELLRERNRGEFMPMGDEYEVKYLDYLHEWSDTILKPSSPLGEVGGATYLEINVRSSRGLIPKKPHFFECTVDIK